MTCLSESTLLAILERRLSPEEMARVDQHVDQCETCRGLVTCLAHDVSTPARPEAASETPVLAERSSPPSATTLNVGTLLADRYLVLELVGAGGMGVVYAAYDRHLDRKVALKMVRADQGTPERLVQEARSLARLTHPNVVVVHDVGEAFGQAYMAMEFVQGSTLRRWQKEARPSAHRVLDVYLEAAKGLAAAHAAGLVHRDIKPENILLGDDGRVRVMDFGLARAETVVTPVEASEGEAAALMTTLEGTWPYIAPERFQGEPANARSDQFAFCVSLYEGLYGEHPFAFAKLLDLPAALKEGRFRDPPRHRDVDKGIRAVLLRGLSIDPTRRFASMDDLATALLAVTRRKRIRTLVLAGLGTVALFGASIAAFASNAPPPPCSGSERLVTDVWNSTRKADIDKAMVGTGLKYAPTTSRTVQTNLDQYARRWVTEHTQACQATRVHGEQSEEVLDLRMACLGKRLSTLRALTDRLAHADARTVEKAAEATQLIGAPELCDEQHVVAERFPPPDKATDVQVKALRERLAQVESQWLLGHDTDALKEAKAIAGEAESVRYPAIQAEAGFWLGVLMNMRQEPRERETALFRALHAAEEGSQERIAMELWFEISRNALWATSQMDQASRALDHVEAYATRLDDDQMHVRVLVQRTSIMRSQDRNEEGLRTIQEGVARCESMPGCTRSYLHRALVQLAIMHGLTGDVATSMKTFDRALVLAKQQVGDDHPTIVSFLNDRATVLMRHKRYEEAAQTLRQALAMGERVGVSDEFLGFLSGNLGTALFRMGAHEDALAALQRCLTTMDRVRSPNHPSTLTLRAREGDALAALKRGDEAFRAYQQALRIQAKMPPKTPPEESIEDMRKNLESCGAPCTEALKKLEMWDKEPP